MKTIHQTAETIRQRLDLIDAINSKSDRIEIWAQDDDGEWHSRVFGNEAAAAEFEAKGRKRGFATKRGA